MRVTVDHPKTQLLLAERARQMRHQPTRSEAILWHAIRARALGVAVRRQVVVGRHIVDFLVPSVKFIIEVDGPYHRRRAQADARRERALLGYTVLRLEEEVVVEPLPEALARIRGAIREP